MNRFIKPIIFLSIVLCPLINFAGQEEKKEREEKVAQEVNPKKGIKPKIAYKIELLGKLKVITKDLKQAAHSFNNKFARGLISTLVDDMGKITPAQDTDDMLKALDKITQNLNKIKDPKWVNPKEMATVESILAKAQALKNSYQKNIDLSRLQKPNEILDLLESEPLSMEPFMDLILAQQETKMPYILARVTEGPNAFYFDANSLNTYIFNGYPIYPNAGKWELDGQKMKRKEGDFGFRQTVNPLNRAPLNINDIDYFTLNSLKDTEFKYLASLNDLINKQDVQNIFYKNSGMHVPVVLQPFKELDSYSGNAIAISSNNKFILTSGRGAKMWDAQTGNAIHPLVGDKDFATIAISPDNRFIATGYMLTPLSTIGAQIWDAQTGAVLHSLAHKDDVSSIAISSDNKFVVTGSYDHTAKIWDAQTGARLHTLKANESPVIVVAISPNNKFVVTSALQGGARIWDLQTGQLLHTLGASISAIAISPNNQFVITAAYEGVQIWNAQTGALIRTINEAEKAHAVAISSNNQFVVTKSTRTVKIWDAQTGTLLYTLNHTESVDAIAISSNDKFVITGSTDKTARIWNAQTGALLYTLGNQDPVNAVTISPNNKFVVTGSRSGTTKIWEIPA